MTMRTTSLQNKVYIGNVVRNAIVFNFKNRREDIMKADNLLQTVADLFTLLHERKVDYLLVGGVALLQYIEGRNTEDIDIIMALSSLEKLPEIQIVNQEDYFASGKFNELKIDILLTGNPLFETVRRHYATTQCFVEQDIPCATVEGLLLLKMYALPSLYRQGNFTRVGIQENDIATLINNYHPQLAPLFDVLAHHVSHTDLCAVREIIGEIQQRIERFGKGFDEDK